MSQQMGLIRWQQQPYAMICKIWYEGVTVFLTTHNLVEAEKLCHQTGVIRQGKLLAVGHPDELRSQAGGPR